MKKLLVLLLAIFFTNCNSQIVKDSIDMPFGVVGKCVGVLSDDKFCLYDFIFSEKDKIGYEIIVTDTCGKYNIGDTIIFKKIKIK